MDLTHIPVGQGGWAHLAAIIDCHDRAIIGYERPCGGGPGRPSASWRMPASSDSGPSVPRGSTPVLRSDNGLIFQSRRFRRACRDYRLTQEFITPYTPEQNGMIERFFRSLKEECTWLHNFHDFDEAKRTITTWIRFYNEERPHQSLGCLSPAQYRAQQRNQVA
jgi:putative transposase